MALHADQAGSAGRIIREDLAALGAAPAPSLLVIVQSHSKIALAESQGSLARVRQLRQGDNTLSFYEPV